MVFCYTYSQAQEFDTIQIDNTARPSPTYVRIKFPHQGFVLTDIIQRDANIYPASTTVSFVFKECKGDTGINYFDTGLLLYIDSVHRLNFYLILDSNSRDTSCVQRTSWIFVDTVRINYPIIPTSIERIEDMEVAVYPNPVTDHSFRIQVDKTGGGLESIAFYTMQGCLITSSTLDSTKAEIDLPVSFPSGRYLVQLKMTNGTLIRKLITVQ